VSGALVFVDNATYMHQIPHPLVHGEHLIVYDRADRVGLFALLDHYLAHPEEARAIAEAGRTHVFRHHMAANRADRLLEMATAAEPRPAPSPR
jgi:spore maturation protein CgeB